MNTLKKVYSIWICMDPPPDRRNTINRYHITEENLVGCAKEPLENYDLLCVVMVCLGGANFENYDGILRMLDVLLSTEVGAAEKKRVLQDDYGMLMTEALETEVWAMCNLSQGVEEKGRLKGRAEGVLASIKSLMANTGWPVEKAMEILGVPEADRPKYANLLLKQ